ncbi:uncharacterized protein MAM_03673 [Metarhizium album ARSEF 1941]|uniref:Uncharacterized protein n=1 Tax=Metarhizium album (strain ARSEF 1941) TaxID=1081103 RepID=A0A0B2WY74_METAS|nr:uncharacterized protein MAM_03673 [Metarhizium album ARSEF 1941]KHN98549.1 hypothetical protein MAM_03673 [Metarhizium album ARSEF 1941]
MSSFTTERHSSTPPAPTPKGGSHDVSSVSTPTISSPRPLPHDGKTPGAASTPPPPPPPPAVSEPIPDPGEAWLPELLRDKSTQDLADVLASPALLSALALAPASAHGSTTTSRANLAAAAGAAAGDARARAAVAPAAVRHGPRAGPLLPGLAVPAAGAGRAGAGARVPGHGGELPRGRRRRAVGARGRRLDPEVQGGQGAVLPEAGEEGEVGRGEGRRVAVMQRIDGDDGGGTTTTTATTTCFT